MYHYWHTTSVHGVSYFHCTSKNDLKILPINQSVCQTLSQAGSQSVSESVCLSASVCQSVNRPIGWSVSLSFGLLASWSVCQSLNSLPVCLIVSLSVCLSVCLCVYLSICLSVSQSLIDKWNSHSSTTFRKNWEYEKWQIKSGIDHGILQLQ